MNCNQAKQIKIVDFLQSINIKPEKTIRAGRTEIYKAPYRNEKAGSLHVDTQLNLWFDHGTGTGGSILDLVMIIFNTDLEGSLRQLESKNINPFPFSQQNNAIEPDQVPAIEIITIKPIIHPALIEYLAQRKIRLSTANIYLKEIIYKTWNSKICDFQIYRALGFKNDKSGWELRNKYFKGCNSKHFTTIPGIENNQLNIWEGFFDFLAACELSKTKKLKFDSLILNSVALKEKTLSVVSKYEKLNLFLDNDQAGIEAVKFYRKHHDNIEDFSHIIYPNHKDLNEFLMNEKNH